MNKLLTTLVLAVLWPLAGHAAATWNDIKGEEKVALETKGDPARGEAAFHPCSSCHRKDASGRTSGSYPRLAGQHAKVLIKQIADIRAGRRINPKMEPYSDDHALNPYQIADIAAYLSTLPISGENGKGPGTGLAAGKQVYDKDCAICHGDVGQGQADKFYPMVAAQHYHYLLRELQYIRDGHRGNSNPDMVKVIKPYSDSDLEALADYMAQLPPPKK